MSENAAVEECLEGHLSVDERRKGLELVPRWCRGGPPNLRYGLCCLVATACAATAWAATASRSLALLATEAAAAFCRAGGAGRCATPGGARSPHCNLSAGWPVLAPSAPWGAS